MRKLLYKENDMPDHGAKRLLAKDCLVKFKRYIDTRESENIR